MLEVILDTETTGLSTIEKHRIVEIGCIELDNQIPTNKIFHQYINPQRSVSEDAYKVHGYSDEFLSDKKTFSEIFEDFLNFIKNKKIIIHNAPFDLSFLNYELKLINQKPINKENVIDTLEIARSKYPGSQNSLDALCKRFNIDNSKREKHNALIDCHLLKEIYINLVDQKAPKLNLEIGQIIKREPNLELRNIDGGILVQNVNVKILTKKDLKVVTKIQPSHQNFQDALFTWKVLKHVKSNGILISKNNTTVGLGAGQVSRVDAVYMALKKGGNNLRGAVLASDAFFPFRDSIDALKDSGISTIIQPGGSIRDDEVVQACNDGGISMLFTGTRCFKH